LIRLFLLKLSVIVLPIGLLVCLSNYFIDPANIFSSKKYVSGIAAIMSSGHNVDNVSNYNERLLQEQMIIRLVKTPDIVVLGSSRIMEIGSDFFPGKTVLNCGVSHGNIHDLVALAGLLDSVGRLPGEVYINVDPPLISKGTAEWQSLAAYHDYFRRKTDKWNTVYERADESIVNGKLYSLVSFEYFKEAVTYTLKGGSKKYTDLGRRVPYSGRFSDGTICYPPSYKNPDTVKVASDAWNTGSRDGIYPPDPGKEQLLYNLIRFLKQRQVQIHFIMLPFHPAFYRAVNEHQQNLFIWYDHFFRDLAAREDISVTGTFDPGRLNMRISDFYDMYHCSKEAIRKIITTE
jgi:hypothetical protein